VIALGTLVFMAIDIVSNMNAWSPSIIRDYFIPVEMNITGNAVANHSDPVYVLTLGIGFLLTLGTATFLVYQSFKEHKARNS
jgi:hypothetical protein